MTSTHQFSLSTLYFHLLINFTYKKEGFVIFLMYVFISVFSFAGLKLRNVQSLLLRSVSMQKSMRILNVAEKNSVAKNIALILSNGTAIKRKSFSDTNGIYEFDYEVLGQKNRMVFTSVRGHMENIDFDISCKSWSRINPLELFKAPLKTFVTPDSLLIKKTLEKEILTCSKLIIWTDCDREGENIGFEIINACKSVAENIEVYRARFSEITQQSLTQALQKLDKPNEFVSKAVDVRKELDLRVGAAFTRIQTLYLQRVFPNAFENKIISYGSCQFPTLGFVVERFKAIEDFKSEPFWHINVVHSLNDSDVSFHWQRNKLFNKLSCEVLYKKCLEDGVAKVVNTKSKNVIKKRPKPLVTTELQKIVGKNFRITAKDTLDIAEYLYSQGLISYPRTETNFFAEDIDLAQAVECQVKDARWGEFARKVLSDGPNPFQGNKSDNAHPPIYPLKHSDTLTGSEQLIYEYIVRHFLACLSKDAEALENTVDITIAEEKFSAKGVRVLAENFLKVYPYQRWTDNIIHSYSVGEEFKPEISMVEGKTCPPNLLTEPDLISLMEKHGIGTDSTQAKHIETIKSRLYVGIQDGKYFVPRTLGMGLVEGYNNMGYGLTKPESRALLEADLKRICEKEKTPDDVLTEHLEVYRNLYVNVTDKINFLSEAVQSYIEIQATPVEVKSIFENCPIKVGDCPKCGSNTILKKIASKKKKFISCSAYPTCTYAIWFPENVLEAYLTGNSCPTCGPNTILIQFKFKKNSFFPDDYVGCLGGCNKKLIKWLSTCDGTKRSGPNQVTTRPIFLNAENGVFDFFTHDSSPKSSSNDFTSRTKPDKAKPKKTFGYFKGPVNVKKVNGSKIQNSRKTPFDEEEDGMRCYCLIPCRRVTTVRGANKGRDFYTCGKLPRDPDKCNFFQWVHDKI